MCTQDEPSGYPPVDPFSLVKQELKIVAERLRRSILSDIPLLERAGAYFFDVGAQVCCCKLQGVLCTGYIVYRV